MKKKILLLLTWSVLTVVMIVTIFIFEINNWPVGSSIAGIIAGVFIPLIVTSFQDLADNTSWKETQRKLERGGFLKKDDLVRISFAYLYRIKIDDKYFLIKNARGTEKYQPVGGVYKMYNNESIYLRHNFSAVDDDRIPIDESSRNDYRLFIPNCHLRKFFCRFDKTMDRENISNLGREFKEELVDTHIIDTNKIRYRYCGRHFSPIKFSEHFKCYELLMADIVEIELDESQNLCFRNLRDSNNHLTDFLFVSSEDIKSLGVRAGTKDLQEVIADHSVKILQENADKLVRRDEYQKIYDIQL